jgi:hypothetical protein
LTVEPAEHTVFEGVLTDIPLGRLDVGESREVETIVCFLSSGRFEIGADVRRLGTAEGGDRTVGVGQLKAIVQEG